MEPSPPSPDIPAAVQSRPVNLLRGVLAALGTLLIGLGASWHLLWRSIEALGTIDFLYSLPARWMAFAVSDAVGHYGGLLFASVGFLLYALVSRPRRVTQSAPNEPRVGSRLFVGFMLASVLSALGFAFSLGGAFPLDSWYKRFVNPIPSYGVMTGRHDALRFDVDGRVLDHFRDDYWTIVTCRPLDDSVPFERDRRLAHSERFPISDSYRIVMPLSQAFLRTVDPYDAVQCRLGICANDAKDTTCELIGAEYGLGLSVSTREIEPKP